MRRPVTADGPVDLAGAREKAAAWLRELDRQFGLVARSSGPREIMDEATTDHGDFWLFHWGERSKKRPGEWIPMGGNLPVVVRKSDGAVFYRRPRELLEDFAAALRSGELDRTGRRVM